MESSLTPGLPFATEIYGFWHRGEILASPQNGRVLVEFVDYGSKTIISTDQIKYLLQKFSLVPRQSLRGGLFGIMPAKDRQGKEGGDWDLAATKEMLDYSLDKLLNAKIMQMDHKVIMNFTRSHEKGLNCRSYVPRKMAFFSFNFFFLNNTH
jgi:hypothetical protein